MEEEELFDFKRHTKFLLHMYNALPNAYSGQETNCMMLAYFVVGSLDIIGELPRQKTKQIVDWVYGMQVLPDKDNPEKNIMNCGFRGGSFFGIPFDPECKPKKSFTHDQSHIAMTYTALSILRICGDDFSRVNKTAIMKALSTLQREDGSYSPVANGSENDMRFVYCACAISAMLEDWSGLNKDLAVKYILSSQSYDGAIAQAPGQESHGGSTYCAIAALELMGRLNELPQKELLIQWCINRQTSGFQGRINKIPDSCYSFWIGGTLKILGAFELVDFRRTRSFTFNCQQPVGGIAKWPDTYPDVLHTYLSLCGLSFLGEPGIATIDPALGFVVNIVEKQCKTRNE